MPAYFDTGFSVREPSWHGEETLLDTYPENWDEARLAAGLMWEPTTAPISVTKTVGRDEFARLMLSGTGVIPETTPQPGDRPDRKYRVSIPATGRKAIVRDDTGDLLHVASDRYSVITHADMGDILDAALGTDTNLRFETAGSVRDGAMVWAL